MSNSETIKKFLRWVKANYGNEICKEVETELKKTAKMEKLFSTLHQVLSRHEVNGFKETFNFGNLQYNS